MKFLNCGKTIDNDFLKALEEYWGFNLPKDYRDFLLTYNGGEPIFLSFNFKNKENKGSVISSFFGVKKSYNNNILMNIKIYYDRIPSNFLPIADDVGGNLILLSVKGPDRGKIYFWDHELEADTDQGEIPDYSNLTLIADSFNEFIDGLYEYKDEDAEE